MGSIRDIQDGQLSSMRSDTQGRFADRLGLGMEVEPDSRCKTSLRNWNKYRNWSRCRNGNRRHSWAGWQRRSLRSRLQRMATVRRVRMTS